MFRKASPPFDKSSADVILRTCDQVDFHVHKIVLSLASSFFETMFSIPQPSSPEAVELSVVQVPEHSSTIDCLLRYCYPVDDPFLPQLELSDRVLSAAKKYDFSEAINLVPARLELFLRTDTLTVLSVSCHHHLYGLAARAASQWRSYSVLQVLGGQLPSAHWQTSWYCPNFDDTLIAKSYVLAFTERISAGIFFRFLQYLKSSDLNATFSCLAATSSSISAASTKLPTTEQIAGQFPFNRLDADVILRSQDRVDFRVHRVIIEANNSNTSLVSPLESLLGGSKVNTTGTICIIQMRDDSRTLSLLLRALYPPSQGDTIMDWTLESFEGEIALRAYKAAQRCGFAFVTRAYQSRLRQLLPEDPLRVYCVAIALGLPDIAQAAARSLAFSNLRNMYCAGLETLPVAQYYRLLKYHHSCQAAIRSVWHSHLYTSSINSMYGGGPSDPALFSWLEEPGVTLIQTAMWGALLQRGAITGTPRKDWDGWQDWKKVSEVEVRRKVEEAMQTALDAITL